MPWIEQLQSVNWREAGCIFFGAYVLGCFASGYYLVLAWKGRDIREFGSGNIGAKNVGRLLGWQGLLITVVGDCAKGALAVWAARHFTNEDVLVVLAILGVVAGHIWPAQLRFRGGKGVATSLGALLVYDFYLTGAFLALFAISLAVLRKWLLAGLLAFAVLPFAARFLGHDLPSVTLTGVLAVMVLIAHQKNLREEFHHLLAFIRGEPEKPHTEPTPPEL